MKRTKIITWAVVAGLVILLTAMADDNAGFLRLQ